jgi:hypothetical protein
VNVNPNDYSPTAAGALILSPDALLGALVGAAVQLAGFRAVFPAADETPRTALGRLRPTRLLVDFEDRSASDESLLGPAMMIGARLFVFGPERLTRDLPSIAIRFQVTAIVFPRDIDRLREILATPESESTPRLPQSTAP